MIADVPRKVGPSWAWTTKEERRALDLRRAGSTWEAIAEALADLGYPRRSADGVQNHVLVMESELGRRQLPHQTGLRQRLREIMADGLAHPIAELVARCDDLIRYESANRRYEREFAKTTSARAKPAHSMDDAVLEGKRRAVIDELARINVTPPPGGFPIVSSGRVPSRLRWSQTYRMRTEGEPE